MVQKKYARVYMYTTPMNTTGREGEREREGMINQMDKTNVNNWRVKVVKCRINTSNFSVSLFIIIF